LVVTKKAIESEICKNKLSKLLLDLKIEYKDISLYILAFIHRSIVNERNDFAPEHNERLEFLWDAVLELVITQALYKEFPDTQEWVLTDLRSALVRWRNLAEVAKILNFQEYLFLWKWEEKSWGRENDYILANTVESFIWALYLDLWFDIAHTFIIKYIYSSLSHIQENKLFKDFKTLIQEYTQAEFDITPHYEVLEDSGPDHDKTYVVGIYMWERHIGSWTWSSKKKAQESAAENAYLQFKIK